MAEGCALLSVAADWGTCCMDDGHSMRLGYLKHRTERLCRWRDAQFDLVSDARSFPVRLACAAAAPEGEMLQCVPDVCIGHD